MKQQSSLSPMRARCFLPVLAFPLLALSRLYSTAATDDLPKSFRHPPDSARPGVYWYFMDGNLSREGMTRDLESMKAAGIGHLIFLEVNVGVPRGPVGFLSEQWQDLFAHAVDEAERLGIEIILGSGPGWTGSGGPWVKPEQSMQHLLASKVEVQGPGRFQGKLPVPPPHRPFFGDVPPHLRSAWESFYRDVAVLAFPRPSNLATISDIDEKSLVYRAPFSSQPNVKPRLPAPADFPADPPGSTIPLDRVIDITKQLKPDGSLDWQIPEGKWTVLRFVSRNNGASTRPAPAPGIGFECDKFDAAALDAHFDQYVGKLLKKLRSRRGDKADKTRDPDVRNPPAHGGGYGEAARGWTMLHMDSWEMGAQNWTPKFRGEFRRRRGYDPQPFFPAYAGMAVGSREQTERFLWDLRITGQELVIENHAERLKQLGREHGFKLSIEPYDMNPVNDFDLGAVADVPMCEFWSLGFDTSFSCQEASSIAHVLGRPIVAAEAFTAEHNEAWKFYPGQLKNQGDWALATGVNRFTIHTFAHKPDEGRPGMVMGPYGVHWDRGQTWWPMVSEYHDYLARCSHILRQGRSIADALYLMPEGAPNVFQPPASAFTVANRLPDRRGYNFDGCSALTLMRLAEERDGKVVFPSGAAYQVLVLPNCDTMTPALLRKIQGLVKAGATVIGNPPRKSPSLMNYPVCDREVAARAEAIWGSVHSVPGTETRSFGKGRIVAGDRLYGSDAQDPLPILEAQWIWYPVGEPARSAPVGTVEFRRAFTVAQNQKLKSALLQMTADNAFKASINGSPVLEGQNFNRVYRADIAASLKPGTNILTVVAENGGDSPNPAGLIGAVQLDFEDSPSQRLVTTGTEWTAAPSRTPHSSKPVKVLGSAKMAPWHLNPQPPGPALYPLYDLTAAVLRNMGVAEDFASSGSLRYTHRRTAERDIYFVANRSDQSVETTASFRVTGTPPELWDPLRGSIRCLPQFTCASGRTEITLRFAPYESYLVVFPASPAHFAAARTATASNFPDLIEIQTLSRPWDVSLDTAMGAPAHVRFETLEDWSKRAEPALKYYSGIATYRTTFDLPAIERLNSKTQIHLDLGNVQVMARVRVNGTDCGITWTAPWRVNITRAVTQSGNILEIDVANLWPNRMIGDAALPEPKFTQTSYRPYKATDHLLPSGLLGPVRLLASPD